jgi:hypothetical protein
MYLMKIFYYKGFIIQIKEKLQKCKNFKINVLVRGLGERRIRSVDS